MVISYFLSLRTTSFYSSIGKLNLNRSITYCLNLKPTSVTSFVNLTLIESKISLIPFAVSALQHDFNPFHYWQTSKLLAVYGASKNAGLLKF